MFDHFYELSDPERSHFDYKEFKIEGDRKKYYHRALPIVYEGQEDMVEELNDLVSQF